MTYAIILGAAAILSALTLRRYVIDFDRSVDEEPSSVAGRLVKAVLAACWTTATATAALVLACGK